ncbi:MAG: long-chain-acyl-CoA synthetase, partial [Gammaproteobacteria bacterium]|nr:long-chain-acyl-CoA synthetase [Gammaproteobacteria bacterium]
MKRGRSEWSVYLSAVGPILKALPLLRLRADSRHTIADYIERQVAKYADLPFILFEDRRITYREYNAMANRIAHWGLSVGLKAGDTIGFMMENRAEYVPVWSGFSKIGVKAALINTNLVGASVVHALEVAGAERLLLGPECAPNVADAALSNLPVYVLPEEGAADAGVPGAEDIRRALAEQPDSDPDAALRASVCTGDSAFHIYTSGTTGLPKATNFNHQKLMAGGVSGALLGLGKGEVVYCPLPLYHSAGGIGAVMIAMGAGGAVAVAREFSASRFWDDVRRYDAKGVIYIGELCRFLLNRPPDPRDGEHGLRWMFGIGLRADVWEPFQERFRIPRIVEGYGATEANVGGVNFSGKVGSVGKIRGGLLLRYDIERDELVRDAKGRYVECGPGEAGELLGRIPAGSKRMLRQFQGYTDPEATERKILRDVKKPGDAYFRSGDLLRRDDKGYYYFVDRIGDTFRWKGENVSTQEVAEALSAFPGVETANVYGVEVPGQEG